jgi:hypothetical protein
MSVTWLSRHLKGDGIGSVKITANEELLTLLCKIGLTTYSLSLTTCTTSAKCDNAAFADYGG